MIQFWYPTVYRAKADIGSKLVTSASATITVLAIKGGVFITANPLVQVSTDPTATLYYYWLNKFMLVYVQWYWEIIAFKITWGFRYKTWWFGWSGWKIIKQWSINGLYGKYKILTKWYYIPL